MFNIKKRFEKKTLRNIINQRINGINGINRINRINEINRINGINRINEINRINGINRINNYFNNTKYKTHIVIYDTYPNINNAEKEVIIRFKHTCEKLQIGFLTITNDNIINNEHPLKNINIINIPKNYIDCIISLHFESPKSTQHYTLMALWNPLNFHKDTDLNNVCSVDGYISCYSKSVDDFFISKCNKPVIGYINHTLSEPILDLSININKCFYIGLNWEKLNTLTPERTKILNILKKLEVYNLISIYGPKKIGDIELWKGYRSYIGEIPFDGTSVIYEIKKCGICLVFSSDSHINAGISSNRLFEGLAAGVPLICDKNPFILKWFEDNVFYIDTTQSNCAEQIINHIKYIRENPSVVLKKMENCRKIFTDNFLLDKQLSLLLLNITNKSDSLPVLES